mgnify:CR=1 FL=1
MKRLEPKKRGLAVLAILLVATSLAATVTGLVLKAQLQKYVGGWEDRLAIAVPFMLLHDAMNSQPSWLLSFSVYFDLVAEVHFAERGRCRCLCRRWPRQL